MSIPNTMYATPNIPTMAATPYATPYTPTPYMPPMQQVGYYPAMNPIQLPQPPMMMQPQPFYQPRRTCCDCCYSDFGRLYVSVVAVETNMTNAVVR
ncbi:hypothetical protein RO3G_03360 [Rhizopus delemar RA 99-880]|uniref:Uncharacterized protein n=3 Tax=Rhizopus TaxID=4842 RepID=I1BR26_RHIO9|nr:hypothetical protein RO3G_03360 [Rhizopus delemar RA 99-880]|eukprot:EIE78656.1 hypothetical protein RO3G_03360 [Rhizopus delemar RA 99-880]